MAFRVAEIQATPNPNALKFILHRRISERPISFLTAASTIGHPLAERLFAIRGVVGVLLLGDFVTINKSLEVRWADITPRVRKVLAAATDEDAGLDPATEK